MVRRFAEAKRVTGLALTLVLLGTMPAVAQHTHDGNIYWDNGTVWSQSSGAACGPNLIGFLYNDTSTNPLLGAPLFPSHNFVPASNSIANGYWDDVSQITYQLASADTCDRCGCPRTFDQVCYRGAVPPAGLGPDWTTGWTCFDDYGACHGPYQSLVFKSGPQAASQTWDAGHTYVLQGKVNFLAGTTLTIQPGTIVVGELATGGYLVIERGAQINAQGTAVQPIVMTTDQDPPVSGGWGGLVIHGRAVANCADCLGGQSCVSEGGAGEHCGNDDCDNSGIVRYVRIQYSGIEIAPNNELNCLTMNSVGCGTTIEYVQTHQGSDDCFEWFGGKVKCRYLVASGTGDDGLDWQMGYRGTVQFAVVQHYNHPLLGDKGIEADNNEFNYNAPCRSNPLFANVTLIGTRGAEGGSGSAHSGIHLRRGTDSYIFNSIIAYWPVNGLLVQHTDTCGRGVNPQPALAPCVRASVPVGGGGPAPQAIRLAPNPVVEQAQFSFRLAETGLARLNIYDVHGRLVARVLDTNLPAGEHEASWSPSRDVTSGTYFYRLETQGEPVTGRLTVVH